MKRGYDYARFVFNKFYPGYRLLRYLTMKSKKVNDPNPNLISILYSNKECWGKVVVVYYNCCRCRSI